MFSKHVKKFVKNFIRLYWNAERPNYDHSPIFKILWEIFNFRELFLLENVKDVQSESNKKVTSNQFKNDFYYIKSE